MENHEEKKVVSVDAFKAADMVREHIFKTYQPWVFLFQIESVKPNSKEKVFIVNCSFFPVQGGYEKKYYTIKVNILSGDVTSIEGFSYNLKTGEKKPLDVEPPIKSPQ